MNILHVISSVDPRSGGPIDSVNTLSEVWLREGHVCHIACLDNADATWVQRSSAKVFAFGNRLLRAIPGGRYGYTPKLTAWLKRHAKDYHVVIVHGLWNYASFGSWRALHRIQTPYYVFTHGMMDPWFNKAFPIKAFYKLMFWKGLENRVLRDARGVLFTAVEECNLASQSFKPYSARPYVVGLGTRDVSGDPERQRQAFIEALPQLNGRRFLLFLSRIHPKKGVDLLIKGFAHQAALHPDLDLVIAGPDQVGHARELQDLSSRLGIGDRVHWPGMLTGDVKWGAFRSTVFFALTSHQENFGIAVAESLVVGTPVLITQKVNIWREIESDGAGVVVTDDSDGVNEGLRRVCAMSPATRQQMSEQARQCFLRRYDINAVASGLLRLFADHAKSDGGGEATPLAVPGPSRR